MTTILLIFVWAASLYVAGTICIAKGYKKGYADGCEKKWEDDPETAKMSEKELFDKYGRYSILNKEKEKDK